MNALIYTGSTGAGHTNAAKSIKTALEENGHQVEIIDAFKERGKLVDKTVSKGYQQLVDNYPKLYRYLYRKFDSENRTSEIVLKNATKILKSRLLKDINEKEPDLIISTHPIVTNMLGRLKDQGEFDQPILAFVTDFIIHDVYLRDSVDGYIVANEYTKQTMINRGIDESKIYTYGIPIRAIFRQQGLPKEVNQIPTILVMGGSLGGKGLKKTFQALLNVKDKFKVIVVCGSNKKLEQNLKRIISRNNFETNKEIEILGFCENIPELMDQSDAIITKPGGLTASEAISKNIPIIIPFTYPGQEEYNRDYLVSSGLALSTDNFIELTKIIENLIEHKHITDSIKKNMVNETKNYSMNNIVKLCESSVL